MTNMTKQTQVRSTEEAMKLALEAVYETIIQWDEGGGKRSRRELARRIVALATQPAQQQQEPQTSAQERTEFEQFWVDELGEADELTYGKLGYAIRRVDVAWEAWKAGKISANHQTIAGRKVWIDWKAQALELRELVRLNGIKIAELKSEQPAQPQQEPVAVIGSTFQLLWCREDWSKGLRVGDFLYTSPPTLSPAQRQARSADTWVGLTPEEVQAAVYDENGCVVDYEDYASAIEAKLKEKNSD